MKLNRRGRPLPEPTRDGVRVTRRGPRVPVQGPVHRPNPYADLVLGSSEEPPAGARTVAEITAKGAGIDPRELFHVELLEVVMMGYRWVKPYSRTHHSGEIRTTRGYWTRRNR